jgi:cellulose synthase/poly-beta-1,6-N-acetylglucosamine synthase-like glycosyltransferase
MSLSPKSISIIIPAYNAEATLQECLEAVCRQSSRKARPEVIVVDDGSDDRTREIAASNPGVRLVCQAHQGPAAARNLGVQQAAGEVVLFTDSDCAPVPDWLEKMSAPFEDDRVAGVKGAYYSQQTQLVARFVQLEYEDKYDRMKQEPNIDFIDTYSAGYRKDVFLANGGFDNTYPTSCVEDQEFSFRLAKKGHKMVFVPEARVFHMKHAETLGEFIRKKSKIGYWKVRVHTRHPDKIVRDSHTPPELKLQILLVFFILVSIILSLRFSFFLPLSFLLGLIFLASTLPFTIKAWKKDRQAAVISPILLLVRAAALGTGFGLGLISSAASRRQTKAIEA